MSMKLDEAAAMHEQTAKVIREMLAAGGVPAGYRLEYWSECEWRPSNVSLGTQKDPNPNLHYRLVRDQPEKSLVPHAPETFREWYESVGCRALLSQAAAGWSELSEVSASGAWFGPRHYSWESLTRYRVASHINGPWVPCGVLK